MTTPSSPSRREQILRAASRLFAERGFHGVGMDEIGAAVGISGPALYRHFPGKDAMLTELLVGISSRLRDGGLARVREAAAARESGGGQGTAGAAGRGPGAALDALITGHIDFALDDRALITLHDRELDRLPDAERKRVRRLQREYVELWVGVVRQVYPALPEKPARVAVHAVFGLLNSTPRLARPGSLPDRETTAALLRRLAAGAFAAAAAPASVPGASGARGAPAPGPSGAAEE